MSWSATARKNVASATGSASLNVTLNSTVAGNMIAVASSAWKSTGPTGMAVSDGTNGAYTSALFAVNGSPAIALHYLPNNAGGNLTITATPAPGSTYDMAIAVHEFSGGNTSAPASGTPATNTGTGTTDSTGTMTPADNDVLLLAVLDHDSYTAVTENAASEGFTLSNENEGPTGQPISLVYKIITGAPGTPSHSWSAGVSAAWAAGIAAFKPASSVINVTSAINWRNQQNPRLRGPIRQSRFQRTQLWSTGASQVAGPMSSASSNCFVTAGTLTAGGQLSGRAIETVQTNGSLTGKGIAGGSSAMAMQDSGNARGAGAMAGVSQSAMATNGTVTGKGRAVGGAVMAFAVNGSVTGRGVALGAETFTISTGGTLTAQSLGSMVGKSAFSFQAGASMRGAGAMAGAASAEIETAVVASGRGSLAGRSAMSFTVRAGISFSGDLPWMRYPLTTVFQDAGMETQIDQSLMATVIHATEMTTEVLP